MVGGGVPVGPAVARGVQYNGGMTTFVLMTCIVAASGGMLFGYDNGVTGGVTAMESFLNKFFPNVYVQEHSATTSSSAYCKFNDQILQLFTSSLFLAGMIASFPASQTTKHLGRKPSMIIAAVFYLIGAGLVTGAVDLVMLVFGRVFLGFGVGFANQCVTLYNSEMAPANLRGAMNILFQLAVTLGILLAQLVNYGIQDVPHFGWRVSVGIAAVPAFVLLLGGLFLPETPNSLIERGQLAEGERVLRKIRGVEDVSVELRDIQFTVDVVNEREKSWRAIFLKEYRPQLVICMAIPFFQQFTGINAIIFYAPQLFASFGSGQRNALLSTLIIGVVNVVATLVAVFTVDRFGRRPLLIEAGFQMLIAEIAIAVILALGFQEGNLSSGLAVAVIVLICVFISAFAWSWGPLGWLIPSEICPLEIRSTGQAINVAVNFLFTFVIGQTFLSMLCTFQYGIFLFFGSWVVIMTLFAYFFIPETKGIPIETLMLEFDNHWFWRRYAPIRVAPSTALQDQGAPANGVKEEEDDVDVANDLNE